MRLKNQKGFTLIPLIIAMVLMSALAIGIHTVTTSSNFGELLATKDYNAYQLAKAGLRYAVLNGPTVITSAEKTYCMSGGQCFTIKKDDTTTPGIITYTSVGGVSQGTFLAANRQLTYDVNKLIYHVQSGLGTDPAGGNTSLTATFASPTKAGSLVVVYVKWINEDRTPTVSDGVNTYNALPRYTYGWAIYGQMFYCYNCSATTTVTVNFGNYTPLPAVVVSEFYGLATDSDPLDARNGVAAGSDTLTLPLVAPFTLTSGSMVTTQDDELIVGLLATYDDPQNPHVPPMETRAGTAPISYTRPPGTGGTTGTWGIITSQWSIESGIATEYAIVDTRGTYATTGQILFAANYVMAGATFKGDVPPW